MKITKDINDPVVVSALLAGGVVVLRTDTLYGLLALADEEKAVARVYHLKGRDSSKSPIVLIAELDQLYDELPVATNALVEQGWPAKTSLILPSSKAPLWIRRHNDSVAYRLPSEASLRELISETGRLIAPSANPEGQPPSSTIEQAIDYFGDAVDVYVDGGLVDDDSPSQLWRYLPSGGMERLR